MSENEEEFLKVKNKITLEEESDMSVLQYDESDIQDTSQVLKLEETSSSENQLASKPKILIQRVFHQPEKHVVEQKLDYVIANSEEEITKHVYGGLFRNKYYKYAPESYCQKHAPDLYEHKDETLVKLGDKFDSQESFRLYVDGNAKRWKYYLKCADSHRKSGKETFVFKCVFARQRSKHSTAKGLRKRTFAVPRGDCPCRVILKPVPFDAKDYTVIYVCNHHDHPLTDEYFYRLQHGRRIHPSIKAELMDLLSLEVDREVVKKYFESLTGYSMNFNFFQNMLIRMKKNKIERQFSLEKLKEMSKKIEKIKEELGMNDEEENVDNDLTSDENVKKDKASQVAEVFNVLKAVSAPKKIPQKMRTRRSHPEFGSTPTKKRIRRQQELNEEATVSSPQSVNNKSRLETRLQELKHDRETLQSIKHLQDSVRCETENNPWVMEDVIAESGHRSPMGSKVKRARNSLKQSPIAKPVEVEPQAIVIENAPQEVAYVENQDIIYENEITVMDTTEHCPETVVNCVNIVESEDVDLNENNVSYCIQYDDGEQEGDQSEQQFVLMLDDVESFENLPEVQIQATEFATVSIVSENHQNKESTEVLDAVEQDFTNVPEGNNDNNDVNNDNQHEIPDVALAEVADQIHVIDESGRDASQDLESTVYEVIETNDRKILPSKEIVRTVILNKPPKSIRRTSGRGGSHNKAKTPYMISRKPKKTDVISQYFKEKSERYMSDVFGEDLENLGDDECYMIVVNDEDTGENSYDWMENFDEYEIQKPIHSPTVTSNDSLLSYESTNAIKSERMSEYFELEKTRKYKHEQNTADDSLNERKQLRNAETCLHIKEQQEKEVLELQKAIDRLKSQKLALERDVEHLVATKDDLIEDITKAARLSRRMFK